MSTITHNTFYTAYTYLSDLFGITMPEDVFETIGYVAWSKIGNRETRMYRSKGQPVKDHTNEWYVDVPCNAHIIEAVTTNYEDHQRTTPTTNLPNSSSFTTENQIESIKSDTSSGYISGKFVKFRQLGDRIYLTEKHSGVNILYKGIYVDDEGLPFLNDKEVHAIATYCAYTDTYKKGIQTKDRGTIELSQMLKQDWQKACSQARVPQYINQNEMNEILNANSSWNRKLYNRTLKIMQ